MYKIFYYSLTVFFSLVFIIGCGPEEGSIFRKNENSKANPLLSAEIMEIVRSFVIDSGKELSEDDKNIVLNYPPEQAGCYKIAADYGQCSWLWKATEGKMIRVYGTGSLSELTASTDTWLNIFIIEEN